MNALIAATFAILAVSASAAPSLHGWGVNPHALSPIGPSGIVTGHGASGPSGTVTGAGAVGPSGIVTGAGPIGPTGPAGHGVVAAPLIAAAPVVAAAPLVASSWAHAAPLAGVGAWGLGGHGAWGVGGHGLALAGHGW